MSSWEPGWLHRGNRDAPRRSLQDAIRPDDRALLEPIGLRDAAALAELYDRYAPTIHTLLINMLDDRDSAAAILHDLFVALWRGRIAAHGNVLAALLTAARSKAIVHARGQGTYRVALMLRSLDQLSELSAVQRQILGHVYFRGSTILEVAAQLDMPAALVRSHLCSAMKELRQKLLLSETSVSPTAFKALNPRRSAP